jgi:enoyl-CoA hydratase
MALVETELDDGVAVVTLNDPARRNAFFPESIAQLVATVDDLEADPACRALVVTGAPPAFCGGASLATLATADEGAMRAVYAGFLRVGRCTLPTVAAVNGAAVGAGMNLALACDVRIVAESGWFETRFLRLGLHPGGGHTWMLRNLVGPQAAAALLLFGEIVRGADAVRLGLAHACVPDGDLLPAARRFAGGGAGDPALAREIKRTLRAMAAVDTLDDAVERELGPQVWSLDQPFFRDGLRGVRAGIASRRPTDGGDGPPPGQTNV